jgi:hypothetical protein
MDLKIIVSLLSNEFEQQRFFVSPQFIAFSVYVNGALNSIS